MGLRIGDRIDRVTWDRCYDFKNIYEKIWRKNGFFGRTTLVLSKHLIVFEKNAYFFAENWLKIAKIVIITSTPDEFAKKIQNSKM
jgi:hypothetical protein